MLKKLKFLMVLAAVFAVVGCKAEVTEDEEDVVAETPKKIITLFSLTTTLFNAILKKKRWPMHLALLPIWV